MACRIAALSPLVEKYAYGIWSYPLDESIWFRGGAMNNGRLVTQWLIENFSAQRNSDEAGFRDVFEQAAMVAPGAEGLIFLPYHYGERAPIYDEHARGVFFGLTPFTAGNTWPGQELKGFYWLCSRSLTLCSPNLRMRSTSGQLEVM